MVALMMIASSSIYAGSFDKSRFFIGGQLGLSASSQGYDAKSTSSNFTLSPEAGYLLNNNKWIVGLRLSYSNAHNMSDGSTSSSDDDYTSDYNAVGFRPYAMYHCFSVGPVSFWIEGGLGYDYVFNKDNPGGKYLDSQSFKLNVLPLLTWKPFDHFSFFTALDFLSLGYTYQDVLSSGHSYSLSSFSLGADSDSFLTFSDISVGFRYWF